MTRAQKEAFVAEFQARLDQAEAVYLTDFTGLNVKAMTALRRRLKEVGADYLVVKNRLVKRAVADLADDRLSDLLAGPTGVVFGNGGVAEAARAVADFAKENDQRPVFKAGLLGDAFLNPEKIAKIATLPPRETLLSEVAGALSGPMSALADALGAKTRELAGLLEALQAQPRPEPEPNPEPEPEPK